MIGWPRRIVSVLICSLAFACASEPRERVRDSEPENYLDQCAFKREPGNDWRLLRWRERQMPLKVFLPAPPDGLFEDDAAALDAVRSGIRAWEDVVKPGVPRFEFVETPGASDIPILWTSSNDGAYFIAHVMYSIRNNRFGVQNFQISGRWGAGGVAPLSAIRAVVSHETGHALGIGGHSQSPIDIMYPSFQPDVLELSDRDRATLKLLYQAPVGKRMSGARKIR